MWVVAALLSMPLMAREWTNQSGQKMEADFVSSNGTTVILKRNGKEFGYEIAKLSAADQEFIRQQAAGATSAAPTGWMHDFPVVPAHPDLKGYTASKNFRNIYKAFDGGTFPKDWDTNHKGAGKGEFAYDPAMARARVYVPAGYTPTGGYGIYCHVSHSDAGENIPGYAPVLDRLKLIYVSPMGVSNQQPMLRRIKLAVDAVAAVRAKYPANPQRVAIGGISGGGHMAMLTHAAFPEIFMGSVSHAAQSYLPTDATNCGHFPGLEPGDLKGGPFKGHKWCVISGDKDQNYQAIRTTSAAWLKGRFDYRFFDVPGMGHTNAEPARLEEALKWLGL